MIAAQVKMSLFWYLWWESSELQVKTSPFSRAYLAADADKCPCWGLPCLAARLSRTVVIVVVMVVVIVADSTRTTPPPLLQITTVHSMSWSCDYGRTASVLPRHPCLCSWWLDGLVCQSDQCGVLVFSGTQANTCRFRGTAARSHHCHSLCWTELLAMARELLLERKGFHWRCAGTYMYMCR